MIGILAEKPSARKNMAAAWGGTSGTYNGEKYVIVAAHGHLYSLVDPDKQVDPSLAAQYKSWDISLLPWQETDFKWKYSKVEGSGDTLKNIQSVLSACDEICIATDVDPTGEGELLAWEILDQLHLAPRKWSRMYFDDESEKELRKAFVGRKPIKSMKDDPDYVKAFYRSRWDFMSMQFTRIATALCPGRPVLRQGRLKSAMVVLVGDALKALSEYKKIPYYQNRFRDENGVVYTNPNEPMFPDEKSVPNSYHSSAVVSDGKSMKSTAPPKMLDLASLSARLVRKGYKAKTILETYQRMYESQVVSYPRTEDKVITPEQFNDLLPLVDKIAAVVGVDASLLTHRTPRSTHVKTGGAHGANRPGPKVPDSLQSLSIFDKYGSAGCAADIYELLAKNYLATLAEDYMYESQKGHLKDYPDFKGSASVPKSMGWKQIYDADAEPDADENANGIGTNADPFVYEGFPPKPPTPTMKWLMTQLEKRNVGTGATRTSTYSDVTSAKAKFPLLVDTKGKITMTDFGDMSYYLLKDTDIGSLDITERVMNEMKDIANGKKDPEVCLKAIQDYVRHDIDVMQKNSDLLRKERKIMGQDSKCSGMWNGKEVSFKKVWGGHEFTDEECEKLLNGESITFTYTNKSGKESEATGRLADQEFNGKKYVGFKSDPPTSGSGNSADRYYGSFNGKDISFKRDWGGHHFTDEECEKLINGEEVSFPATSSKGKDYTAVGSLAKQSFQGHTFYGFKLNRDNGGGSGKSTPKIPKVWGQHEFTEEEITALEAGLIVERDDFVSKKGSQFAAKIHYGKQDDGRMGIIPEFV